MNGVLFKSGVLPIATLAPAGIRILGALDSASRQLSQNVTVTCADREHPDTDPHTLGEAFDVRTHDLPTPQSKDLLLRAVMLHLSEHDDPSDAPIDTQGGIATKLFFGWIEHAGTANEHLHVQRRRGTDYGVVS